MLTIFVMNFFCGFFNCDPQFDIPEIKKNSDSLNLVSNFLNPSVKIDTGKIEGYIGKTMGGRNIFSFEGIPYAEPPTGKLRWQVQAYKEN